MRVPWLARPSEAFWSLPDRIRARIERQSPRARGCWLWTGPRHYNGESGTGYARQSYWRYPDDPKSGSTNWLAHRLIYTILVGPVDPDKVLDHLSNRCTARHCVRPDHLEPVTIEENTRRGGGRFGVKFTSVVRNRNYGPAAEEDDDCEAPF